MATIVRKGDICLSACALAFLGGTASRQSPTALPSRVIEIGGQVGFHNFSLDATVGPERDQGRYHRGDRPRLRTGQGRRIGPDRYAADLGVDPGFIAQLLARPPDNWLYVDTNEMFLTVGACPSGPEPPLGRLEQQAVNVCNHASGAGSCRRSLPGATDVGPRSQANLLEQVQRNIASANVKGPLVGQLAGVLASRDDRLIDSVYSDLRAAGISLPDQVGRCFIVSGYSFGELQAECHVTLSTSQPEKFDFVWWSGAWAFPPVHLPAADVPGPLPVRQLEVLNPKR